LLANDLEVDSPPIFDTEAEPVDGDIEHEFVEGAMGPLLMLRRTFLNSNVTNEDWRCTALFRSSCTIAWKVCQLIINSGSCENVLSELAVQKLGLTPKNLPKPYKLVWLNKSIGITVSHRVLLSFSIGPTYSDEIFCDVVPIDACQLLLGRPWQFDCSVMHDGHDNTYSFPFQGKKIVLLTSKTRTAGDSTTLLSRSPFEEAMTESGLVFVLLSKHVTVDDMPIGATSSVVAPLLADFS